HTPIIAPRGHAIRRSEIGVEFDRAIEQPQRLAEALLGPTIKALHPTQVIVIGVEALGGLALGAFDLGRFLLRPDAAYHVGGHAVLQLEDVFEAAVETLRPQMRARGGVDELAGDAQTVRRFAHATLEHVAHPQLAADLLHIDRSALVGKAGIAR